MSGYVYMNNKYQTIYTASLVCNIIAIIVLPCTFFVMLHEYYNLSDKITTLQYTKEKYRHYIHFCAQRTGLHSLPRDFADCLVTHLHTVSMNEDEEDFTFLALNRSPLYLRDAAYSFAHNSGMISPNQLDDVALHYTEDMSFASFFKQPAKKNIPKKATVTKAIVKHQSRFAWPIDLNRFWFSSPYGPRKNKNGSLGFHYGIDLAAIKHTPVHASAQGVVVKARFEGGYGNVVEVQHTKELKTRYAHLETILVRVGQRVSSQTILGRVGETGFIRKKTKDGSHLHFEICKGDKRVNPIAYLPIIKTVKI